MKKTGIHSGAFCLFASLLVMSCQKEYSYEGGPMATYLIQGSPAECTLVLISGFYVVGTPAGTGNTLQLTVKVTTVGNYTISTTPSDGISFSAFGNFADTGTQVVTLQGIGTPESAGSFLTKIPGDNGCYFTLNVLKKTPASYTLSGYPGDCSKPIMGGTYSAGTDIKTLNMVTLGVIVDFPGDYTITTDSVNGFYFSATGHFSMTGTQTVVLQASGRPENPGLFVFNVKADSSQCSFSIPVQSPEPLATYVLQSGVGASGLICSPQSIEGIYTAGVVLNSSNTITIKPYVTVSGNYTISTKKINGIFFSASGNFPAPGEYSVILKGNGTPLASGSFTFTPLIIGPAPIGGSACDVSLTVQ